MTLMLFLLLFLLTLLFAPMTIFLCIMRGGKSWERIFCLIWSIVLLCNGQDHRPLVLWGLSVPCLFCLFCLSCNNIVKIFVQMSICNKTFNFILQKVILLAIIILLLPCFFSFSIFFFFFFFFFFFSKRFCFENAFFS